MMRLLVLLFLCAVYPLPAISDSDKKPDRNQRAEMAQKISEDCRSILDKTPSPSPREEEWLERELGGSPEKFLTVYHSPEYSRDFVHRNADNCYIAARAIVEGRTEPWEMYIWAQLARVLDAPDWEWHLNNAMNRQQYADSDNTNDATVFRLVADDIFDNIVIPYLKRSTEKVSP